MLDKTDRILSDYTEKLIEVYGRFLKRIILYGSYARGDFKEGSDIDVMILVDCDDALIQSLDDVLYDVTFDINYDNDIQIMPIVKNERHFKEWIPYYPFYRNVMKEGVSVYEAA